MRERHSFRPAARGAFSGPPSLLTPRRPRTFKGRGSFTWACDAAGSPVIVRGNRHGHSRDPCPFGHRSSPEAPSLRRHYPASLVLQASPPPCRSDLTLAGCRLARATPPDRASRVASIPLFHACCRHYPGGTCRCLRRSLPDRWQPSPISRRVGFRIARFGACSAFTGVAARMVAKPPLAARCIGVLQTMSLPPSSAPTTTGWNDSCRAGFAPAEEWRLSTAHAE